MCYLDLFLSLSLSSVLTLSLSSVLSLSLSLSSVLSLWLFRAVPGSFPFWVPLTGARSLDAWIQGSKIVGARYHSEEPAGGTWESWGSGQSVAQKSQLF